MCGFMDVLEGKDWISKISEWTLRDDTSIQHYIKAKCSILLNRNNGCTVMTRRLHTLVVCKLMSAVLVGCKKYILHKLVLRASLIKTIMFVFD